MSVEQPKLEVPEGRKDKEKPEPSLEEFEGLEYELEEKKHDPLYRFIREQVGEDPEQFNFAYKAVKEIKEDPQDLTRTTASTIEFSNYHDFLKFQKQLTNEQREAFIGTSWQDWRGHTWTNPGILAKKEFWERLDNPEDKLFKHREEIFKIIESAKKEELPDEYEEAVKRGAVNKIVEEEKEKLYKRKRKEKKEEKPEEEEKLTGPEKILAEAREKFTKTELEMTETSKTTKKLKADKLVEEINWKDLETIERFSGVNVDVLSPEEKQALCGAESRKSSLVQHLRTHGIDEERANKIYEDIVYYKYDKLKYLEALQGRRTEMYEKALAEIEKLGLSEEKANELFKQKMEEIIKTTVVVEANNLYDTKTRLELETKGDASFAEKGWKFAGRVVDRYRRMPLKYKVMISAGLFAGGFVAGAAGGATGAALAGGIVAGRTLQRVLSGAATAVGLEAYLKRRQEKKAERKTLEAFTDNMDGLLKEENATLDEKLFELVGKKKGEKYRRYVTAGLAGGLIIAGRPLYELLAGGAEEVPKVPGAPKPLEEIPKPPSAAGPLPPEEISKPPFAVGPIPEAPEVKISGIETASEGDSVWKMIDRQLETRYGEKFTSLDEARKTYIIDGFKDRVAADPEKFDLTDIDQIKLGQKINFSSLFEDRPGAAKIFGNAAELKQSQLDSIIEHNRIIKGWVVEHPGEKLTTDKIDEIIYGRKLEITGEEITQTEKVVSPEELPGEEVKEKMPGEYVAEKPEIKSEDIKAESAVEQIATGNELTYVKAIGLSEGEWNAIQNVKVGKLLEQIPSRDQAWEIWRSEKAIDIDLSHDGLYGAVEFGRHIKLAEVIRSFRAGEWANEMTLKEFLQRFGPKQIK